VPLVGFEPMIPAFERAKTVHALDCAATEIGVLININHNYVSEEGRGFGSVGHEPLKMGVRLTACIKQRTQLQVHLPVGYKV
jgi:hypothetical protein